MTKSPYEILNEDLQHDESVPLNRSSDMESGTKMSEIPTADLLVDCNPLEDEINEAAVHDVLCKGVECAAVSLKDVVAEVVDPKQALSKEGQQATADYSPMIVLSVIIAYIIADVGKNVAEPLMTGHAAGSSSGINTSMMNIIFSFLNLLLAPAMTYYFEGAAGLKSMMNWEQFVSFALPAVFFALSMNFNLLVSNFLDAAMKKCLSQLRIPMTALIGRYMMGHGYTQLQWLSIFGIFISVLAYQQLTDGQKAGGSDKDGAAFAAGLVISLIGSLMSVCGSICSEKYLKAYKSVPFYKQKFQIEAWQIVGSIASFFLIGPFFGWSYMKVTGDNSIYKKTYPFKVVLIADQVSDFYPQTMKSDIAETLYKIGKAAQATEDASAKTRKDAMKTYKTELQTYFTSHKDTNSELSNMSFHQLNETVVVPQFGAKPAIDDDMPKIEKMCAKHSSDNGAEDSKITQVCATYKKFISKLMEKIHAGFYTDVSAEKSESLDESVYSGKSEFEQVNYAKHNDKYVKVNNILLLKLRAEELNSTDAAYKKYVKSTSGPFKSKTTEVQLSNLYENTALFMDKAEFDKLDNANKSTSEKKFFPHGLVFKTVNDIAYMSGVVHSDSHPIYECLVFKAGKLAKFTVTKENEVLTMDANEAILADKECRKEIVARKDNALMEEKVLMEGCVFVNGENGTVDSINFKGSSTKRTLKCTINGVADILVQNIPGKIVPGQVVGDYATCDWRCEDGAKVYDALYNRHPVDAWVNKPQLVGGSGLRGEYSSEWNFLFGTWSYLPFVVLLCIFNVMQSWMAGVVSKVLSSLTKTILSACATGAIVILSKLVSKDIYFIRTIQWTPLVIGIVIVLVSSFIFAQVPKAAKK